MGSPRFRKLPDGRLTVPSKGKPPDAPDGYIQDFNNPYIYYPDTFNCVNRTVIIVGKAGCGCEKKINVCKLTKQPLDINTCEECKTGENGNEY